MATIIGIESSCDETSVAVLHNGKILSNIIADQKVHAKYGGVVPEMASREHLKNIIPVFSLAIRESGIELNNANAIAYTNGPGLLGPLLVGSSFAKGLHLSTGIPLVQINHMEAHVLAHFIEEPIPEIPFLCLTVSGGHTQLVLWNGEELTLMGETLDDAGGEAFDKIGKMLGLSYPAGPQIDQLAQNGNPKKFSFPIIEMEGFSYSFSGLKTNVLYFLQKEMKKDKNFIQENLNDLAASIQSTIVQTLLLKLEKAALHCTTKHIGIAGGVAANSELKEGVQSLAQKHQWTSHLLKNEFCTDNAAMIARAGEIKIRLSGYGSLEIEPSARLKF